MGHRSHQSFKTPGGSNSVPELRAAFRQRLDQAGIQGPQREADWILESITGKSRAALISSGSEVLAPRTVARGWDAVFRREAREPLQYILGETDFYGYTFKVSPGVLIPRPETETLVERALQCILVQREGRTRILDIGTGSGCIACAISLESPRVNVTAIDVSSAALEQARGNAARLGAKVEFIRRDLFERGWAALLDGQFDLVLSNPPYVPDRDEGTLQPELSHEPPEAIFTMGPEMRFMARLAEVGRKLLAPGGRLFIEIHSPHVDQARAELISAGYQEVITHLDLAGNARVLEAAVESSRTEN